MGDLDNGLGLEAFVRGSEAAGDASASSQAVEPAKGIEQSAEGSTQAAEGKGQSAEGSEPGGAKEDSKESSPSAEGKEQATGNRQQATGKEEKTEGGGQPADGKPEPGKEEQAQTANWDSEENPYRQEAARLQERIVGANRWSNEVHKQNLELRRSLERLEKKIDGTFDPEEERRADLEAERAAQGSPEDAAQLAELRGATVASLHMAYETMGKEKTDAAVREFDSLFQNNPLVMQRVTASRRPVQEALKILSEFKIAQKYGTQDLTQMIEKIREEAIAQAMPALTEKITKEIMGKLDLKNKENGGLKHLRGSGRDSATEQLSEAAKNEHKPLSELFTAG